MPTFALADTEESISQLDNLIKESKKYDKAKEKNIAALRSNYAAAGSNSAKWKACNALYDAYSSYKYDSAYAYANREISIARSLNDQSATVIATCDKVFCLLSAGLYKEAADEIRNIKFQQSISREAAEKYYYTHWRLLVDLSDYVHTQPYQKDYVDRARVMVDSAKMFVGKNSWQYDYMESLQLMKEGKLEHLLPVLEKLLARKDVGLHDKAIIASNIAWLYRFYKNDDKALAYFALSAGYDIQSATKETTSAREAGSMLYEMNDYNHAITYVQKALEDANFYGARQRIIEINNILPIIQRDRYDSVARQRNTMIAAVTVVSILFILLCVSLFFLRRKVKELQDARHIIVDRNKQLEQSNKKLQESDKIKTEYIGRTFTANADFINLMEKLYRTLDHKIMAHQYDDLLRSLQESKLNAQRKSLYADFDDAFLTIFPDFIEQYNALFDAENRKEPDKGQKLTTEMRIFALIRLGVTDSDRIANFLHYSVNTINTYKTRVKNKSLVTNEEFEERIMAIDA